MIDKEQLTTALTTAREIRRATRVGSVSPEMVGKCLEVLSQYAESTSDNRLPLLKVDIIGLDPAAGLPLPSANGTVFAKPGNGPDGKLRYKVFRSNGTQWEPITDFADADGYLPDYVLVMCRGVVYVHKPGWVEASNTTGALLPLFDRNSVNMAIFDALNSAITDSEDIAGTFNDGEWTLNLTQKVRDAIAGAEHGYVEINLSAEDFQVFCDNLHSMDNELPLGRCQIYFGGEWAKNKRPKAGFRVFVDSEDQKLGNLEGVVTGTETCTNVTGKVIGGFFKVIFGTTDSNDSCLATYYVDWELHDDKMSIVGFYRDFTNVEYAAMMPALLYWHTGSDESDLKSNYSHWCRFSDLVLGNNGVSAAWIYDTEKKRYYSGILYYQADGGYIIAHDDAGTIRYDLVFEDDDKLEIVKASETPATGWMEINVDDFKEYNYDYEGAIFHGAWAVDGIPKAGYFVRLRPSTVDEDGGAFVHDCVINSVQDWGDNHYRFGWIAVDAEGRIDAQMSCEGTVEDGVFIIDEILTKSKDTMFGVPYSAITSSGLVTQDKKYQPALRSTGLLPLNRNEDLRVYARTIPGYLSVALFDAQKNIIPDTEVLSPGVSSDYVTLHAVKYPKEAVYFAASTLMPGYGGPKNPYYYNGETPESRERAMVNAIEAAKKQLVIDEWMARCVRGCGVGQIVTLGGYDAATDDFYLGNHEVKVTLTLKQVQEALTLTPATIGTPNGELVGFKTEMAPVYIGTAATIALNYGLRYGKMSAVALAGYYGRLFVSQAISAFAYCSNLRLIVGEIVLGATTPSQTAGMFSGCGKLKSVKISGLRTVLDLTDCPEISFESLKWIVEHAENTITDTAQVKLPASVAERMDSDAVAPYYPCNLIQRVESSFMQSDGSIVIPRRNNLDHAIILYLEQPINPIENETQITVAFDCEGVTENDQYGFYIPNFNSTDRFVLKNGRNVLTSIYGKTSNTLLSYLSLDDFNAGTIDTAAGLPSFKLSNFSVNIGSTSGERTPLLSEITDATAAQSWKYAALLDMAAARFIDVTTN